MLQRMEATVVSIDPFIVNKVKFKKAKNYKRFKK